MWLYPGECSPPQATHVLLQPEAFGPESASIASKDVGDCGLEVTNCLPTPQFPLPKGA